MEVVSVDRTERRFQWLCTLPPRPTQKRTGVPCDASALGFVAEVQEPGVLRARGLKQGEPCHGGLSIRAGGHEWGLWSHKLGRWDICQVQQGFVGVVSMGLALKVGFCFQGQTRRKQVYKA